MITIREIDPYRKCDLPSCREKAAWELTLTDMTGRPRRVFVCGEHHVEGFCRVRELGP